MCIECVLYDRKIKIIQTNRIVNELKCSDNIMLQRSTKFYTLVRRQCVYHA